MMLWVHSCLSSTLSYSYSAASRLDSTSALPIGNPFDVLRNNLPLNYSMTPLCRKSTSITSKSYSGLLALAGGRKDVSPLPCTTPSAWASTSPTGCSCQLPITSSWTATFIATYLSCTKCSKLLQPASKPSTFYSGNLTSWSARTQFLLTNWRR